MNQTIEKIYQTGSVVGRSGQVHKLHSAIDRKVGEFLFSLIRDDPTIRRTLEVGCAYGLSSLYICTATRDRAGASHTIIDPFQNTHWDGVGVASLKAAEIDFFKLLEIKSEFALPKLLERNEGQLDFIFIDGWHTFDHTLLDCFYATRLLRIGGLLAIDDVSFTSVRRVIDFLKNYPCYEELGSVGHKTSQSWKRIVARGLAFLINQRIWAKILPPILYRRVFEDYSTRMIVLRKTKEDSRNWDWHIDSF
jgi:predicted O-methyltransferase YrrM